MVGEEGGLLFPACPEGEEVYHRVRFEGAPDLADQKEGEEEELLMTSHCLHPCYALLEEAEEEAL